MRQRDASRTRRDMIHQPSRRRASAWVSAVATTTAPAVIPSSCVHPSPITTVPTASPAAQPSTAPIASDAARTRQRISATGFRRAASSRSRSASALAQLSRSIHAVCVHDGHVPSTSLRYPQWSHRNRQSNASFIGRGPPRAGFLNRR